MKSLPKTFQKGFTLIELLVVIAVIGILAVVLLVAIDPVEKINQANDAGVKSNVGQLSNAALSYGVNHNSKYPSKTGNSCGGAAGVGWMTCLKDAGDIKALVSGFDETAGTPDYDYTGAVGAADSFNLRKPLTSKTERSKAAAAATATPPSVGCTTATNTTAWFVYSSGTGNTIYVCTAGQATLPGYQ